MDILTYLVQFFGLERRTPAKAMKSGAVAQDKKTEHTVHRVRKKQKSAAIKFSDAATTPDEKDLTELCDAFTGEPIDPSQGLRKCTTCKVYYHLDSYKLLVTENFGKCVSCFETTIVPVKPEGGILRGKNNEISIVTIQTFAAYVGRVVTFDGYVNVTGESGAFQIIFEDRSWTRGFNVIVFRGKVTSPEGMEYVRSLSGKRVRIRGLLRRHDAYGFQIIISHKHMITPLTEVA
jgi:hypothetical protein